MRGCMKNTFSACHNKTLRTHGNRVPIALSDVQMIAFFLHSKAKLVCEIFTFSTVELIVGGSTTTLPEQILYVSTL